MRYCKLLVPALVALLAGAWAPALGQSDRGAITGTVKDPKGGVVPDAKVTATDGLHLRTGPSTDHAVILTIPHGAMVHSSDYSNGWYKVSYSGHTGWCDGDGYRIGFGEVSGQIVPA